MTDLEKINERIKFLKDWLAEELSEAANPEEVAGITASFNVALSEALQKRDEIVAKGGK